MNKEKYVVYLTGNDGVIFPIASFNYDFALYYYLIREHPDIFDLRSADIELKFLEKAKVVRFLKKVRVGLKTENYILKIVKE